MAVEPFTVTAPNVPVIFWAMVTGLNSSMTSVPESAIALVEAMVPLVAPSPSWSVAPGLIAVAPE